MAVHVIVEGLGDVGLCRLSINVTESFVQFDNVKLHILLVGMLVGVVLR